MARRCHRRGVHAGGQFLRELGGCGSFRLAGCHELEKQRLDEGLLVGVEGCAVAGQSLRSTPNRLPSQPRRKAQKPSFSCLARRGPPAMNRSVTVTRLASGAYDQAPSWPTPARLQAGRGVSGRRGEGDFEPTPQLRPALVRPGKERVACLRPVAALHVQCARPLCQCAPSRAGCASSEDLGRARGLVIGRLTFRGRPIPVTCRDREGGPTASGPPSPSPRPRDSEPWLAVRSKTHVRTAPGQGPSSRAPRGRGVRRSWTSESWPLLSSPVTLALPETA